MTGEPMNNSLTVWGSRDEVRELNARLTTMALSLPGGARLDRQSILALAQASIAHNLNPLNGEIWIIPGSGLMIGIKGLRKKAREQLGKGGNFEVSYRLIVNAEEKAALNIPAGAIAYEATLTDSASIETYVQQNERLLTKGMPWERVAEMMGPRPCSKGIGFALPSEKSKMGTAQLAMKRAEAHVIKQKFDVNFADVDPSDESPITFSGDWIENDPAAQPAGAVRTPEEQANQDAGIATLYEEQSTTGDTAVVDAGPEPTPEPNPEAARAGWPAPTTRPAAAEKPANRATATASLKIRQRANVEAWEAGARELVKEHPKYGDAAGKPNNFHILAAAKKCLFDSVTDENFIAVLGAISERAAEQVAEPA